MKKKRRMFIFIAFVLLLALTGCSGKEDKKNQQAVLTVNETDIYMNEMMYYIFQTEMEGNQQEEIYQGFFDKSYWDLEKDDGITNREAAKSETMDNAISYEIFYQEALKAGFDLNETELDEVKKQANIMLEGLTSKQKKVMQITEESLVKILSKTAIADLYYEQVMENLDVDEAAAVSGIFEEDYQQFDVEYLYVPTIFYEEESNIIPYTEEEKKEAVQTANALLKRAKEGIDFETIAQEKEGIEFSAVGFLEGDELLGANFEKEALKLSNGEVADDVIEEEDGFYIIKMMDNNSTQSYDALVSKALEDARSIEFDSFYKKLKDNYKISINESIWKPIVIGELTYDEKSTLQENVEK